MATNDVIHYLNAILAAFGLGLALRFGWYSIFPHPKSSWYRYTKDLSLKQKLLSSGWLWINIALLYSLIILSQFANESGSLMFEIILMVVSVNVGGWMIYVNNFWFDDEE